MNRIGPPPLNLVLPADLAGVDPVGLRALAGEHRADALAAAEQARTLRAAVVRLVPAAWLGLGSLGFAAAALFQAGNLEAIAVAQQDLADALQALGGRLEQACGEAALVVRAGARLDEEVAAENAVWGSRPEPERPDPDAGRLAAQDAEGRLLLARLNEATETARRAWAQATAAFDLVAYRMPDLAARMAGTGTDWRPSTGLVALPADERRRLLGVVPGCLGVGWAGSGALIGPDGRRYPLVVPWVEQRGVRWTADQEGVTGDTGSLDGADPGWHELAVRVGVDTFGSPASTATKAAVITAGFVGNAPRMIGRLRPDLLHRLNWTQTGVPSLRPLPTAPAQRTGGTTTAPLPALVRDGERLRWVSNTATDSGVGTRATARANPTVPTGSVTPAAPNVLALADSGLAGLDTAGHLDDGRLAAYRATFEENADGRIRARLTLYQVRTDGSSTTVLSRDAGVDAKGDLVTQDVRYRPPFHPVMTAAPAG